MGAATLVLAVSAFVATKANNKRFGATFQTASTLAGGFKVIASSATFFSTVANSRQVFIRTAGSGTNVTLYTAVNQLKKAYKH